MKKTIACFLLRILLITLCLFFRAEQLDAAVVEKSPLLQGSSSLSEDETITASDYCDFLNAEAAPLALPFGATTAVHPNDLYDERMLGAFIVRTGFPGNYCYNPISSASTSTDSFNSCITSLSWNDAEQYCNWRNHAASTSTYNLTCCNVGAAHVDRSLKSNLLTFQLVDTGASAYQAGGPEVAIADTLLDEVIEELVIGIVGIEAAGRLRKISKEQRVRTSTARLPSLTTMEGGYLFPKPGGGIYCGRRYTEHALERMAPETPEIIELLTMRAFKRAKAQGLEVSEALLPILRDQPTEIQEWWRKCCPQPREILPTEVEAEIARPHSTDLKVITDKDGTVITVMRKKTLNMKKLLKEIQDLAERTAKQFGYYTTLFRGRQNKVKTFSKKIAKSTSAFDEFSADPHMAKINLRERMAEWMERMSTAEWMERTNSSPKVVTIWLQHESARVAPFTKVTLSSAISREAEAREAERCNPLHYQEKSTIPFGTLFTRWIEPYLKEKLEAAATYAPCLKNSERSYMEEILLSHDKSIGSSKNVLVAEKLSLQTDQPTQESSGPLFIRPRRPLPPPYGGKSYLQALCSNLHKQEALDNFQPAIQDFPMQEKAMPALIQQKQELLNTEDHSGQEFLGQEALISPAFLEPVLSGLERGCKWMSPTIDFTSGLFQRTTTASKEFMKDMGTGFLASAQRTEIYKFLEDLIRH